MIAGGIKWPEGLICNTLKSENWETKAVIRGAWGIVGAVLALLAYLTPISVLYEVWCGIGALLVLPSEIIPFETLVDAWRASCGVAGILALFYVGALLLDLVELG